MSDDEKELQAMFDETAAAPTGRQLDAFARKAALIPARRRPFAVRFLLVVIPTAALALGGLLLDRGQDVREYPQPVVRTIDVDDEPIGPGPDESDEPTEVASEQQDWSADFADEEDPISALEVD